MDFILNFCELLSGDEYLSTSRFWDRLDIIDRLFFVELSKYCVRNEIGHTILAQRLLLISKKMERYEIVRKLAQGAQGGYGETYLVKSSLTGKEYVCKVQEASDEAKRELETLLALKDLECVVTLENAWVKDGYFYMILEKLVPCHDSAKNVKSIRSAVEKCLLEIHKRGWTHGDINDQNVLCASDNPNEPVLLDFGEAKKKGDMEAGEFRAKTKEDFDSVINDKHFTFKSKTLRQDFETYWPNFKIDLDNPKGRQLLINMSSEEQPGGDVYIASMNMRGKWATSPEGCQKVNVTSAQVKKSKYRLAFSPMTPLKDGYKGYCCFENYWQAGKRYKGINDIEKQLKWWKSQKKGFRRYPAGKGKKIKYAEYPGFSKPLDYIPSRKLVYVPEYYNLVKDNPVLMELKKKVKLEKKCITIYDFDGPRRDDGSVTCQKVTLKLLREKLNDSKFPFGHGYVIAAALAGFTPQDYL